jgi:hypothetical protein
VKSRGNLYLKSRGYQYHFAVILKNGFFLLLLKSAEMHTSLRCFLAGNLYLKSRGNQYRFAVILNLKSRGNQYRFCGKFIPGKVVEVSTSFRLFSTWKVVEISTAFRLFWTRKIVEISTQSRFCTTWRDWVNPVTTWRDWVNPVTYGATPTLGWFFFCLIKCAERTWALERLEASPSLDSLSELALSFITLGPCRFMSLIVFAVKGRVRTMSLQKNSFRSLYLGFLWPSCCDVVRRRKKTGRNAFSR